MRSRVFRLLLPLLLLPAAASAQQRGAAFRPYVGVGVGTQEVPNALQDECTSDGGRSAAEARVGVARGAFALEARAMSGADLSTDMCPVAAQPAGLLPMPPDGTFSHDEYDFNRSSDHYGFDLRLRWSGSRALPVSLSAGGGWLASHHLPYFLASAGVRTSGRLRVTLDAEREWFRIEGEEVTRQFQNSQLVNETREPFSDWRAGLGLRLGLELGSR